MNRSLLLVPVVFVFSFAFLVGSAEAVVVNVTGADLGDTYVKHDQPTTNFGSDALIVARDGAVIQLPYFFINISSLDIDTVNNATLYMYESNSRNDTLNVDVQAYEQTNQSFATDFDENTLTWSNGGGCHDPTLPATHILKPECNLLSTNFVTDSNGRFGWDITSAIQNANGDDDLAVIVFNTTFAFTMDFESKEGGEAGRTPYLEIDYTEPAPNPFEIDACGFSNWTSGNTYTLTQNISTGVGDCLQPSVSDLVIDCNFFGINGAGANGVQSSANNITVQNCYFNGTVGDSINIGSGADNWTIKNNVFADSGGESVDITSSATSGTTIENNTFLKSGGYFLRFNNQLGSTIKDNFFISSTSTVVRYSGASGSLDVWYNNYFEMLSSASYFDIVSGSGLVNTLALNTTLQAGTPIFEGLSLIGGNYWSTTGGNGFSDTCADSNDDGICDSPIRINDTDDSHHQFDYHALAKLDFDPNITNEVTDPTSPQVKFDDFTNVSVQFNATVTDDFGVSSVILQLSNVNHTASQDGDVFYTTQDVVCNATNSYQWIAVDSFGQQTLGTVSSFNSTCLVSDVFPPTIAGEVSNPASPITQIDDFSSVSVQMNATVNDTSGVASVVLVFKGNNVSTTQDGNTYYADGNVAVCNEANDWYFIATDTLGNQAIGSTQPFSLTCIDTTPSASGTAGTIPTIIAIIVAIAGLLGVVKLIDLEVIKIEDHVTIFASIIIIVIFATIIGSFGIGVV